MADHRDAADAQVDEAVNKEELEQGWRQQSEGVISGMAEWRAQHPRATLREIEEALDERLERLRAQMLQDTALTSPAADWAGQPKGKRPLCPHCGTPLTARGKQSRTMQTYGGQQVALQRTYGSVSHLQRWAFPPSMRSWACTHTPSASPLVYTNGW